MASFPLKNAHVFPTPFILPKYDDALHRIAQISQADSLDTELITDYSCTKFSPKTYPLKFKLAKIH